MGSIIIHVVVFIVSFTTTLLAYDEFDGNVLIIIPLGFLSGMIVGTALSLVFKLAGVPL